MKTKLLLFFVLIVSIVHGQQQKGNYSELSLDSIFCKKQGAFVLYDLQNNTYQVYNPDLAKEKFPVYSTSKIFWSIVGLEEGLIANETDIVKWDSVQYPPSNGWPAGYKQDQTIVTALHYSVNWYYIELLKGISPKMTEKYLSKMNYQKGFRVKEVSYFDLTSTFKKSAYEQIEFLKGIYFNTFHLSAKTLAIVKKGMLYKSSTGCTVFAKTGTGPLSNDNGIGWLIGWIEKGDKTYFFAFHVEDEDEVKAGKLRYEYSSRVLKALNFIE